MPRYLFQILRVQETYIDAADDIAAVKALYAKTGGFAESITYHHLCDAETGTPLATWETAPHIDLDDLERTFALKPGDCIDSNRSRSHQCPSTRTPTVSCKPAVL